MKHLLSILLLLGVGCTSDEAGQSGERAGSNGETAPADIPAHIQDLENLTVLSVDEQALDTVVLEREQVFESGEEVFMKGYTGEVVVDDSNRVYVTSSIPGDLAIYVFEPDGRFVTSFGRFGRGPGEFESIGSMILEEDRILLFDPRLQKISTISLDDYSLIDDHLLDRSEIRKTDTLAYTLGGNHLFSTGGGDMLLRLRSLSLAREDDKPYVLYYRVSDEGVMIPGRILELRRFPFFFRETRDESRPSLPFPMVFSPGSVEAVADDGTIYSAWTEDFLIKVHDMDGTYQRAIYHRWSHSPLDVASLDLGEARMDAIENNPDQVPETWPALNTLELDDQNRLWVSTITDSDSTFQWWVIDSGGELLARFTLPGERASRSIMSKPFFLVRNGYLYTKERDISRGIDRIVKSRIEFRERE